MLNDPLKLSKEGLSALSDSEFNDQRKKLLTTLAEKKRKGEDVGQDEMLYKAYETERRRRTIRPI